ncbi:hypothetical protein [Methylobacterium oxalidis]|uniref:hypothetical protein n=1 Tax=Methylobacterium oxalidis TaxID=944322 RepID=UPI0033157127
MVVVMMAVDMPIPVMLDMLVAIAMPVAMSRTMDTDSARPDVDVLCQGIAGCQD